jgi:hypothetical protein
LLDRDKKEKNWEREKEADMEREKERREEKCQRERPRKGEINGKRIRNRKDRKMSVENESNINREK